MYADDIILLFPSVVGLQYMLNICNVYGHDFDSIFNGKKCMFRESSLLRFVSCAYKMATMPTVNKFSQIIGYAFCWYAIKSL